MNIAHRLPALLTTLLLAAACGDDSVGASASDGGSSGAATDAGSTGGTGDDPTGGGSGGASDSASGGSTGDINPWDDPVKCHSGTLWTLGDQESPLMHPGRACITCHSTQTEEPDVQNLLQVGGTVFDFGHDPDDCYGVNGSTDPTTVEITDAMMMKFTLPVGPSGNFLLRTEDGVPTFPITAVVRRGDLVRAMGSAQQTGDCNSCHTQDGASGAPGRIVAP